MITRANSPCRVTQHRRKSGAACHFQDFRHMAVSAIVFTALTMCPLTGWAADKISDRDLPVGVNSVGEKPGTPSRSDELEQDWTALLASMMTSPGSKRLAIELEALIQKGDLKRAESLLGIAVETGAAASLIMDRVQDPRLLKFLRTMAATDTGLPSDGASTQVPAATSTPADARVAELQVILEQERGRAERALNDVSNLRGRLAAAQANEDEAVRLKNDVLRERQRAEAALSELDSTKAQLAAVLKTSASRTADFKDAFARQKDRADAAVKELEIVKTQFKALEDRLAYTPATLAFQSLPTLRESSLHMQDDRTGTKLSDGQDGPAPREITPSVPAPKTATLSDPADRVPEVLPRPDKSQAKPQKSAPLKLQHGPKDAAAANKRAAKNERPKRPASVQQSRKTPEEPAPYLPGALRPDDGLWEIY